MAQDPSTMYSGPYRDPADNLANSALMNAGKVPPDTRTPEQLKKDQADLDRQNAKLKEKAVDLVKGKAPEPPKPKAPKPESWMYSIPRAARK